jgi:cellulose synthase/poly-beta-1,6-N-acetylglucosamine synthase-like glycosyltransferase
MLFFIALIILLYGLQISKYRIGWDKINPKIKKEFTPKVSIVIAMRNEESEIKRLISVLKKQIYPTDFLEIILVNDHSTDATLALLKQAEMDNLQIINMPDGEFGKKNAISKAVQVAKGEIILASDADCSFTPNWVRTMVAYFANEQIQLVSGPVGFHKQKGIFQSLQALEFASLIGSGAGAIGMGNAIFCNGANMAYRKAVFLEVNDFESDKAVSGDDVFLLHSVKSKYPKAIAFAKNENAIVTTEGVQTIKGFINQRKRWTAKSSGYKDWASIYTSLLVLFTNVIGVILLGLSLFDFTYLNYFLYYFALKFLADLYLLLPVLSFFNRKDLAKWILPFEFFYSCYIVLIVILSFTNTFEWKGRTHKK